MNKSLIICGASGFGKEVAWLAKRLNLNIVGFLDDDSNLRGAQFYGYPILGQLKDWVKYSDQDFSLAIASPRVRKLIVEKMYSLGEPSFITMIDPSAIIEAERDSIGVGSILCAGSICTADVKIGDFSIINKQCSIGHDVTIQDYCTVSPKVMLGGHVEICDGSEIGAASTIRQQLVIGEGANIGMGSVVVKNVEPNSLYLGAPAKKVKSLETF